MDWAIVIVGSFVLQIAACAILRPSSFVRWITGAIMIGVAYNLPLLVLP